MFLTSTLLQMKTQRVSTSPICSPKLRKVVPRVPDELFTLTDSKGRRVMSLDTNVVSSTTVSDLRSRSTSHLSHFFIFSRQANPPLTYPIRLFPTPSFPLLYSQTPVILSRRPRMKLSWLSHVFSRLLLRSSRSLPSLVHHRPPYRLLQIPR